MKWQAKSKETHDNLAFVHNDGSFSLVNINKISVKLITKGASIVQICTPDRNSNFLNIALSLESMNHYGDDPSFAGATLGPAAGRIRGGRLCLAGETHQLSQNEGQNHLHGGVCHFSRMDWDALGYGCREDYAFVVFGITVRDGLDGYPGFRRVQVEYRLDSADRLTIHYSATTDRPTWLNLSSHCYWNLSGNFGKSALDHTLQIPAKQFWQNRPDFCPETLTPVKGTPFDFETPAVLANNLATGRDEPQLRGASGYNHCYLLHGKPAAVLTHTGSGRVVKVFTDYPALQLYSGGLLDGRTRLAGGLAATLGCAIALEPQERPLTGANEATAITPGETWQRTICYKFETT